jgi:hypothetical protein
MTLVLLLICMCWLSFRRLYPAVHCAVPYHDYPRLRNPAKLALAVLLALNYEYNVSIQKMHIESQEMSSAKSHFTVLPC